jgi:GNAT superfamily N-acetyltransferase
MKIREAKMSDLDNLSVLFNSYRMFYGKESDLKVANQFLRSRIQEKNSKIFVCDVNNNLTGFAQLYPLFSSTRASKYWLLNDLFVDTQERGKGYSKQLINEAKKLVLNTNACGMMLETEKNNKIGNSLYPSVGFKINRLSNFYEWTPN